MAQDRMFVTYSLSAEREHCVSLNAIISCDTKAGICSLMSWASTSRSLSAMNNTQKEMLYDVSSLLKQVMRDKGLKTTQVNESKSPFPQ